MTVQAMTMFTIGADHLPGTAKAAEEAGEFIQVFGKLVAMDGAPLHWDGSNLSTRLVEESGDLLAALMYLVIANDLEEAVWERAERKLALFEQWHEDHHR